MSKNKKGGGANYAKQENDATVEIAKINRNATIIVGLLTTIGVCITAILASPFLLQVYQDFFSSSPAPTLISNSTPQPFLTDTPIASTATYTFTPSASPAPTEEVLPTPTLSAEMILQFQFSAAEGKAPLKVNFSAEGSFVDVKGGEDLFCTFKNVCQYTWSIRQGSAMIYEPTLGDSKFSYTFQKKGEYVVAVSVCRGDFCASTAVVITVR